MNLNITLCSFFVILLPIQVFTQRIEAESDLEEIVIEANMTNGVGGIAIKGSATVGIGIDGFSNEFYGVRGISNTNIGVRGESQTEIGIYGISEFGIGVLGRHNATSETGAGVLGQTSSISANAIGVHGIVLSSNPGANSAAVRGQNNGTSFFGIGVYGSHEGGGWGVYGTSTTGRGIFGLASGASGRGVMGEATSATGVGVWGNGGTADFWAQNGSYGNSSSRRWKTDIQPVTSALEKLKQLNGVTFRWDEQHGGKKSIGFIAEEVAKIIPEIVFFEENGVDTKGMDYTKLSPIIVEAIKELELKYQQKFDMQKKKINELEESLNELKSLLKNEN